MGGSLGGDILFGKQRGQTIGTLATTGTNIYPIDLSSDILSEKWSGAVFVGFGKKWQRL